MSSQYVFEPERRAGAAIQTAAILILLFASGWGIWHASRSAIGPFFLLYSLPAFLSIILVPLLAYRLYSLLGAYYHIERDGMRLRWGFRIQDIPMGDVQWVAPASELEQKLPLPWLRWPGAVLGARHLPDGGSVEYIASRTSQLVLVATQTKIFAISPSQPAAFMDRIHRLMEMGSLSPVTARSIYPSFLLARVWRQTSARNLLLAGFLLNLVLLVWISLEIPTQGTILLGFASGSIPVPAVRLLLLPTISSIFYLIDAFLGLFFYRSTLDPPPMDSDLPQPIDINIDPARLRVAQGKRRNLWLARLTQLISEVRLNVALVPGHHLAYILWWGGGISPALFILAAFFILRASG